MSSLAKFPNECPSCNDKISQLRHLLHYVGSLDNQEVPNTILQARQPPKVSLISNQVVPN
jgi:hypothetical protein